MNIQMMQMMKARETQITPKQSSNNQPNGQPFDNLLQSAMKSEPQQSSVEKVDEAQEAVEIIETGDVKELFDKLDIELDESGQFAVVDGDLIPLDEMLNLEDLLAALGLTPEELQALTTQLTTTPVEDIWALVEELSQLVPQLITALKGEHTMTPKEGRQLVELLKLTEVLAGKTDLTYAQATKLADLKQTLQQLVAQVSVQTTAANTQQQQIVTMTKAVQAEVESAPQPVVAPQPTTETKVVTVTLPAAKSEQSEALLKEMQNLINRSQLSNSNGQLKLLLKLFPENLGQIRIELVQKDGMMTARLMASTALGKELLDANLNQLKTSLVAQNIQLDRLDVTQSLQDAERSARDQHFFNNFFRQQEQEEHEDEEDNEESKSFSEFLQEEAVEV